MAALSDRLRESVVPIRNVRPEQLHLLLEAEVAEWRALHWDFRPSADLVRRFAGMQSLDGFALFEGRQLIGFAYSVSEDRKGLVGDLYVLPEYRNVDRENQLLEATLASMWRFQDVRRVEAQLLMISRPLARPALYPTWFRSFARCFFEAPLDRVGMLPVREPRFASIAPWQEFRHEEAARLISHAYEGHVDASINDQYRTAMGARRFLTNIVQYPGCGAFYPAASWVALERAGHTLSGICLASMVAEDAGHITQVCIAPEHRSAGLGYEMLRRSMVALAANGARTVSLTVTAGNDLAIRLYERMGYLRTREFAAYVWERPC
jgi:ribosomal protein S18 acetylase RimI-like enzyme